MCFRVDMNVFDSLKCAAKLQKNSETRAISPLFLINKVYFAAIALIPCRKAMRPSALSH
jgi:hypothetical protein